MTIAIAARTIAAILKRMAVMLRFTLLQSSRRKYRQPDSDEFSAIQESGQSDAEIAEKRR